MNTFKDQGKKNLVLQTLKRQLLPQKPIQNKTIPKEPKHSNFKKVVQIVSQKLLEINLHKAFQYFTKSNYLTIFEIET